MINKSIFDYARDKDKNAKLLTFYDADKVLLQNLNCIVCMESAADLLGYSNGGFRPQIYVYSTKEFKQPYIKCFLVDDLSSIPYIEKNGIKVSPISNAIVDMLEKDSTDPQILYETFANYYNDNNDSYSGLNIPKKLYVKARHYQKEGASYYVQ